MHDTSQASAPARLDLARVPLQNLVVKFFPEISPVLLCRVMGI